MYLTQFYCLGYRFAKNCQIWWKFDEVMTKTSWDIFGTPCICALPAKAVPDITYASIVLCIFIWHELATLLRYGDLLVKVFVPFSHSTPSFGVTPIPSRIYKTALQFLKLKSSMQQMVKIW